MLASAIGFTAMTTLIKFLGPGYPAALPSFFPPHSGWKKQLLHLAAGEIRQQEAAGYARYLPGWQRKLRRNFNARNFYLTPEGLVFFYPMYAIAPAMEGIPVFTLPYGQGGPALPARDA
jgi:hypothetical protein